MHLSCGDDLISPTVKLSSLKHHLLSSFSSRPHSFSCFFAFSLSHSHFLCSCHVGPAFSAVLPRPFPFFFHFFPFFVSVTFFHHHSLCPPATPLVLPSWENRKRVQASAVAPCDTASFLSFSPDVIWGIHSLATASFRSSPSFFYSHPQKNLSLSLIAPSPFLQQKLVWSMKHFPESSHKCFTRSVWDFKQHPSFVFVLCVCVFFFTKARLEGWSSVQIFIYSCYIRVRNDSWCERDFFGFIDTLYSNLLHITLFPPVFFCLLQQYHTILTLEWLWDRTVWLKFWIKAVW